MDSYKTPSALIIIIKVICIAFVFNFAWEYLHSFLYDNYKGGPITVFILLRAAVFDAAFIAALYLLFLKIQFFKKRSWLILLVSLFSAIIIEIYALGTGRWAYNSIMPVIPIINTGLTPTIQLLTLSYLTFKIAGLWGLKK